MRGTTEERFWAKVQRGDGCWEWLAAKDTHGYGRFRPDGRLIGAHVYSYQLHHGPTPREIWVLHHCDNRGCVRPDHLYLGTPQDNVTDARQRNRLMGATDRHCRYGHPYPEFLYFYNGNWLCKACRYWHNREARMRRNPLSVGPVPKDCPYPPMPHVIMGEVRR